MNLEKVCVDLKTRSYNILIGQNLLNQIGLFCRSILPSQKGVLIGDSNTTALYKEDCLISLLKENFHVSSWQFQAGEKSKNLTILGRLYDFLAEEKLDRKSFLIALGGGVVGDIVGLAAATYLRGIPFIQVPTTLLAQVDSSVGGKTAIDLPSGKNLVGAFYQPNLVLCDVNLLKSLPRRELICGLAEVVKYGIILDRDFFDFLETHIEGILALETSLLTTVVKRCCELKASVTAADETETGKRAILNFGHTIAHAIEVVSGYGKYTHGEAVAIGSLIACKLSETLMGFPPAETERIEKFFIKIGLPVSLVSTEIRSVDSLVLAMQNDKKTLAGIPRFVLVPHIGEAKFGCQVPESLLRKSIEEFIR